MNIIKTTAAVLAISAAILTSGCSDVKYPDTPTGPAPEALAYDVQGRSVTLTWTVPAGAVATEIIRDNLLVTTLPATENSYTVKREVAGMEVSYTVKAVYEGDIVSPGVTVRFTVQAVPAKVAMLIPCADVSMLEDDDEIAAARWFAAKYATDGAIITPADIDGLTPDDYSMIWINIDRVGLQAGWKNLPAELVSDKAVAALKAYVADGGNLFLTKHATQLAVPYGVIDEKYAPGIFGSGSGGEGSDNWCMNANIGLNYDHRGHDIFKGLSTLPDYGHETFALEGPGWREDHNCMWDFNAYGFDGNPNTVVNFEEATHSTVLATWAHVVDYAVGGIIEFHATPARAGRCLAIGLSAYEFHQNTGNPFQENTELLTANCISYMK